MDKKFNNIIKADLICNKITFFYQGLTYKISYTFVMVKIIEFFVITFVLDYLISLSQKSLLKLSASKFYILMLQIINISANAIFVFCGLATYQFILIKIFANIILSLLITDSYKSKNIVILILSYIIFSLAIYGFSLFFMEFLKAAIFELFGIKIQNFYNLTLFFGQILFIFAIFTFVSGIEETKRLKNYLSKVSFLLNSKHIEITGLLDSGNTLYDTKTGKAVIVVSTKVLKRVLNSEEYNQVLKGDFSVLKNCDEIEYVSVGGIQAQMPIVRDVTVKVKSLSETVSKSCVIGFVNQTFTSDKIECLVHKDFVWGGYMFNFLKKLFKRTNRNEIFYIANGTEILPEKLSAEKEAELVCKMKEGNLEARNQLIERNLRLVVYTAQKFMSTNVNIEDLISIGTIGLIKAVSSFDGEKNIKMATYASRCIENEILMHLRKVSKTKREVSLDEPLNTDAEGNELCISDILSSENDDVSKNIDKEDESSNLNYALNLLSDKEKEIMCMRYGLSGKAEMTQKQVADYFEISQSYISRIEKKILDKMKQQILKLA